MARLPVIAAAVLAIAASAPVICTTTSPASAQGWRDSEGDTDRDLRDFLRDRIRTRQDFEISSPIFFRTAKICGVGSATGSAETETKTRMEACADACASGSASACPSGVVAAMRMRMEACADACASGSVSASPSGAVVVRRETVISSPGACVTRTEIYSFSFAGACVAIEDGLENGPL